MLVIKAPWSEEQVIALNRLQARNDTHGYTCGDHGDVKLVATPEGWFCPVRWCEYVQDWAHA